jgi:predicted Zn finger-like uncharacterized protein
MRIRCPSCQAAVTAAGINIQTGMAVCGSCNEVFPLPGMAAALPAGPPVPTARPATTAIAFAPSGDGFGVIFPPGGGRSLGWFFILFGSIWDLISGGMLAAILFGHAAGGGIFALAPLLFVSAFFVFGLGFLLGGVALLGLRAALIARDRSVRLVRTVFGREFVTAVPAGEVRDVVRVVRYSQNDVPVHGLALVLADGKRPAIGAGLGDDEIAWLRWQIMDYCGRQR